MLLTDICSNSPGAVDNFKGSIMTVRELYKTIDSMPETKRMEYINKLLPLLSPISIDVLRRFKTGWKHGRPEQYIARRNKEINECIDWEFSLVGISTRAIQGLPYLDWDTDLDANHATKLMVAKI
jgi:hypothetical protein